MKCLVTGATGFVGSALCQQLLADGAELARCGREPPAPETFAGVDTLFHCAGIAHQSATEAEYEQANFRAVLALARAAAAAGVPRFVFLSSVHADPERAHNGAYGYWKWRAEEALLTHAATSTMETIVLRPALVYGVGVKGNLRRLMLAVRRGLPLPPPGEPRSLIGLPDLCALMCLLAQRSPGTACFDVTDGQSYDLQRLCLAIRAGLGRSGGRAWLPGWAWRLGCGTLDLVGAGDNSWDKLFRGMEYSNAPVCRALAWTPTHTLEDLMPAMLAGLR